MSRPYHRPTEEDEILRTIREAPRQAPRRDRHAVREERRDNGLLTARQRRYGFPPPSVRVGSRNGGDWYDRAAVRAWLAANPRYLTTAARKEFEL